MTYAWNHVFYLVQKGKLLKQNFDNKWDGRNLQTIKWRTDVVNYILLPFVLGVCQLSFENKSVKRSTSEMTDITLCFIALKKYITHTRYSFCVTWWVELHGIRVLWAPNHKGLKVIIATVCLVIHTSGLHHSLFVTAFPLPTRSWHLPSINIQPTDGVATQIWTSLFMEWCSWN
jgi:hypothetical protein